MTGELGHFSTSSCPGGRIRTCDLQFGIEVSLHCTTVYYFLFVDMVYGAHVRRRSIFKLFVFVFLSLYTKRQPFRAPVLLHSSVSAKGQSKAGLHITAHF